MEKAARKEEALRPCEFIGYDRDELGCYFMQREAYKLAESQFARAVWLNPFAPMFKVHHAWALIKMKKMAPAKTLLSEVLRGAAGPAYEAAAEFWKINWPAESWPQGPEQAVADSVQEDKKT